MKSYKHVLRAVCERPWAILPERFAVILDIVAMRANGVTLSDAEIAARLEAAGPAQKKPMRAASDTVAVIPIYGVIVPKADMFTQISGGTSIDSLRAAFSDAVRDPDIGSIVFDVDSPGGQTDLVSEFAQEIRQARGKKPVLAVSNTLMASGAYWLASQCGEVSVSPSSLTGSIGVLCAHDDVSQMQAMEGVKTTLISAGKYKVEGNQFEPLSEDARQHLQDLVDSMYATFTRDVASGRGVNVDAVRGGFGEGRILTAQSAVREGLADSVATLEQTIARASDLASSNQPRRRAAVALGAATNFTSTASGTAAAGAIQIDSGTPAGGTDDLVEDDTPDALCAAEHVVAQGHSLTGVKRARVEAIRDRALAVLAAPTSDQALTAQVAAMRARVRVAATNLRQE